MKLSSVHGQPHPSAVLARSLETGRPAHAYLLHGPDSVGKEHMARAFAASLLCSERDGIDACGRCDSCQRLERSVHADLRVVLPEDAAVARGVATKADFDGKASSTIRVATIRELNAWLAARPVEGPTRVAIVLDAHRVGPEGQNALLKTLEEPRPGRSLILVSSAPSALLATVRSRCQKLRFGALDPASLTRILEAHLGTSVVPAQVAQAIARAGGSAARAIELCDAGTLEPNRFEPRLEALASGAVLPALDLAQDVDGDRQVGAELLAVLAELVARRTRGEAVGGVIGAISRRRATELLDQTARVRQAVLSSANVTLAIEDLLLGLCLERSAARAAR
ncbi:MAG: hypothetical protein U0610_09315 [bacterium]